MPDEMMPPDPFRAAPEDLVSMMQGLTQLHAAALIAGLPERTATQFIAHVFVECSILNAGQNTGVEENPGDSC